MMRLRGTNRPWRFGRGAEFVEGQKIDRGAERDGG